MAEISRVALFGKLNQVGYKSIEAATVFCKMRGNPVVELEHWIHQILQLQDSDLHRIVKQFNLEPSRLAADITDSLERLRPALAPAATTLRRWINSLGRRPDRSAKRAEPGQVVPKAIKRRRRSHRTRKDFRNSAIASSTRPY